MSRYDGLIIPRSYNEYINKTDPVAMSQALQLSGVLSAIVAAGDNKAVKSSAVYEALAEYKYYSVKADVAPNLTTLGWNNYYALLPIPDDVNEILMCSMYGFAGTDNGLRYQLAIGQDKKSLYVAKVNKNDTITDKERIGYMILYR